MKQWMMLCSLLLAGHIATQAQIKPIDSNMNTKPSPQEWDKTFAQSQHVEHSKVSFVNRYGITLVADLYTPKGASGALPAIAVSGPFGAVKEQSSGLYAQTLAEQGFVTLAFDPSYTGESGGEPRDIASPDINTEDFSAAIDYLGTLPLVDRERIGILGICGWGGMALNAAAIDVRIKAVATSTMYDMTRVMSRGYNDSSTPQMRLESKRLLAAQRWADVEAGATQRGGNQLSQVNESSPLFFQDYAGYYRTKRGFHPRSINSNGAWSITTPLSFMNMPLLSYANEIEAPTLIVAGAEAHSRYFSEDAYKAVGAVDKELYIVPQARHVDLYDNETKMIPWQKFTDFFRSKL